ncbi:MAG TPA: rhomboid family intramembrane serine protease [Chthoniobacterales bacterium]|nr:rhomboid family intramembrane serine protease [Chthoniobacterales bacterium]
MRYPLIVRLSWGKQSALGKPWTESRRVVLLSLVVVNVVAFVIQLSVELARPGFVRDYLALSERGILDAYSWQFVTAALLYGGPWHFFGNVVVLYFLGRDLESILGQRTFFYLFATGAVAGEFGHLFLMPRETVLYGASGGVAAILIAYATILPELDLISWRCRFFAFRFTAAHFAYAITFLSLVMLMVDRHGALIHSAIPGGLAAGWLYVHLLGFGHPSWLQRKLRQRRAAAERIDRMTSSEFIEQEIDPLLDKISRNGVGSLSRAERRLLARTREKIL